MPRDPAALGLQREQAHRLLVPDGGVVSHGDLPQRLRPGELLHLPDPECGPRRYRLYLGPHAAPDLRRAAALVG